MLTLLIIQFIVSVCSKVAIKHSVISRVSCRSTSGTVDLNAQNFTLKLSLERVEALNSQFLVEAAAKEVLCQTTVH